MNFLTTEAVSPKGAPPVILAAPNHACRAAGIVQAASLLLSNLECGKPVYAEELRSAMIQAFGGTAAEGLWTSKDAYCPYEVAQGCCRHGGAS
jgi:hypothetical protein